MNAIPPSFLRNIVSDMLDLFEQRFSDSRVLFGTVEPEEINLMLRTFTRVRARPELSDLYPRLDKALSTLRSSQGN